MNVKYYSQRGRKSDANWGITEERMKDLTNQLFEQAASLRNIESSPAFPGESEKVTAVLSSAAIMRIFVVHPDRDLPIDCGPFF